jgi:hypothetical protein
MIASGDKQGTDCWTLAPNVRPASFSLWRGAITKPPLLCVSAAIKKCTYAQHPKQQQQMDIVVTAADNVDATPLLLLLAYSRECVCTAGLFANDAFCLRTVILMDWSLKSCSSGRIHRW